ncbi:MAG: bifunctional phosphopantothenoylcysteine decarboxylase/phosphopantothenate--cysteine ligase CoaBC [Acidobacteriota bacterium]
MTGPRVLLCVSGGIAACKAPMLVRELQRAGAEVRVALTRHADRFVAPLTLEVLSGHAVYGEEYLEPGVSGEELHVTATAWADILLVAPATANTLAQLALGLSPDFVSTSALMFDGPMAVAPAMHTKMWSHEAVRARVAELENRGVCVLGPVTGALANGESGAGRLMEPEELVPRLMDWYREEQGYGVLAGRRVVIAAGPTHEPLDPVRYLGNRSSGKMGFALAEAARALGATVTLVAGPTGLLADEGIERIDVVTALEMKDAVDRAASHADLVIMAAAVADFRPREVSGQKIKKTPGSDSAPQIELMRNPDILAGLAETAPKALRIGFAAETENVLEYAEAKMQRKKVHGIVANDVSRADIGFSSEHNEIILLRPGREPRPFSKAQKNTLALDLLAVLAEDLAASREGGA